MNSGQKHVTEASISLPNLQFQIDIERMRQHVHDLASPSMRGRDVGSKEGARAIAYIEKEFKTYGFLQPWFGNNYQQPLRRGQAPMSLRCSWDRIPRTTIISESEKV